MNWEERINLAGAPGPAIAERRSRTRLPQDRVSEPSRAGPTLTVGPTLKSASAGAIVVGVEDSERSTDALALGQLLAGLLGGPLVLVHNQPRERRGEVPDLPHDEQLMCSLSDSASAQVEDLVGTHREPGFRIPHAASPAVGLRQIAEQENAQLIVVGPSHRSGLGRVRPGGVGEQLLSGTRVARVPVAIAPRGYADADPSLSLIASAFDGSPESRLALDWAGHLAARNAARLRVITVHSPIAVAGLGFAAQSVDPIRRGDLKREQAAAIEALGGPVEGLVRDGNPAGVLVEASREADLLVMGSRGYGPLQAVLLGSVSHYVVRRAACPVVIHPRGASTSTGGAAGLPAQQIASVP
jgi:nucleotide-binding universal stress UspA family protein